MLTLQSYSQTITDILVTSIWMSEKQNHNILSSFAASERLAYLESLDLAEKDKKNLSSYLHDDILQEMCIRDSSFSGCVGDTSAGI